MLPPLAPRPEVFIESPTLAKFLLSNKYVDSTVKLMQMHCHNPGITHFWPVVPDDHRDPNDGRRIRITRS